MNAALSERRGETLKKVILNRYSKDKFVRGGVVSLGSNFPEFLDSLQADSNVPHRDEIIGLIREGKDKDAAFRKVMALYYGKPYEYIRENILPYLRYSKVIIFFHDRIEAPQGPMPQFRSLARTAMSPMPELSKCEQVRVETAAAPEEKEERKYWYPALKIRQCALYVPLVDGRSLREQVCSPDAQCGGGTEVVVCSGRAGPSGALLRPAGQRRKI